MKNDATKQETAKMKEALDIIKVHFRMKKSARHQILAALVAQGELFSSFEPSARSSRS